MKRFFYIGFFIVLALMGNTAFSYQVTRAAFDLGSGKFKMLVARVDTETSTVQEVLYSGSVEVRLADDWRENKGSLSEVAQKRALNALVFLKEKALEHAATEFSAVATAIFRKASNGQALLETLTKTTGIPATVISQRQEGLIGFHTMMVAYQDGARAISWDSGNASFQIVAARNNEYKVYEGSWGNALVVSAFIEKLRKEPYSVGYPVNPVSTDEIEKLVALIQRKLSLPDWLKEEISSETLVRGIGENECIFAVTARALNATTYTQEEVRDALFGLAGYTNSDELFKRLNPTNQRLVVTQVALLYAVMSAFGIKKVSYKKTSGSNLGLLVTPEFWPLQHPSLTKGQSVIL